MKGHWEEWILFAILILTATGVVKVICMAAEETFK